MCEHLNTDGHHVILCGMRGVKQKFCSCGRPADFLCDWKVAEKKSGTCDVAICKHHAKEVAPGKHLCRPHQLIFEVWQRNHPDVDVTRLERNKTEQIDLFPGIL